MQTLHHIHRRKQKRNGHPYPSKKPVFRLLDMFVYIGASIGPVITIPQIMLIWGEKNAAGISSITWLGYACGSAIWIMYGLAHKEKPILFTNIAMFSVQVTVLVGSLIY